MLVKKSKEEYLDVYSELVSPGELLGWLGERPELLERRDTLRDQMNFNTDHNVSRGGNTHSGYALATVFMAGTWVLNRVQERQTAWPVPKRATINSQSDWYGVGLDESNVISRLERIRDQHWDYVAASNEWFVTYDPSHARILKSDYVSAAMITGAIESFLAIERMVEIDYMQRNV